MSSNITVVEKQGLFSELSNSNWWENTELFEKFKHQVIGLRVAITGDDAQGVVVNAVMQKPYPKYRQLRKVLLYINMDAGGMRVGTAFPRSNCYVVNEETRTMKQQELWRDPESRAMDRYSQFYHNPSYARAVEGKSTRYANWLVDESLALCGHPGHKLSNRKWGEKAMEYLERFV